MGLQIHRYLHVSSRRWGKGVPRMVIPPFDSMRYSYGRDLRRRRAHIPKLSLPSPSYSPSSGFSAVWPTRPVLFFCFSCFDSCHSFSGFTHTTRPIRPAALVERRPTCSYDTYLTSFLFQNWFRLISNVFEEKQRKTTVFEKKSFLFEGIIRKAPKDFEIWKKGA